MEKTTVRTRIGILVVSDTRDLSSDLSGCAIVTALEELGFDEMERRLCVDEVEPIKTNLIDLCNYCAVVFTTGGTGFARRDVTPEATAAIIERQANSISELVRFRGLESTPYSYLSRGISGIRGNCLVVNLPGSPKGAVQGVFAISELLKPIMAALSGEPCPVNPPSV